MVDIRICRRSTLISVFHVLRLAYRSRRGTTMRILQEPKVKTGKDLYTEKYEFRYCTGSIEPDEAEEETKVPEPASDSK